MGKFEKLLSKVMLGHSDNNITFSDLWYLLENLGFVKRDGGDGSHFVFTKKNIEDRINIQIAKDGKAKAYQVKQIRKIILKNKL